jgi:hypothetical protein
MGIIEYSEALATLFRFEELKHGVFDKTEGEKKLKNSPKIPRNFPKKLKNCFTNYFRAFLICSVDLIFVSVQ